MMIRTANERPVRGWVMILLGTVALWLAAAVSAASAQESDSMMRIERLRIDHRDPWQVAEALRPLLRGSETLGVIGDWLIVAATDRTRNQVRERLDTLDTPIRRMDISLSFTTPEEQQSDDEAIVTAPGRVERALTLDAGQTVRLDMPVETAGEETDRQLSLQVRVEGRQILVDHAIHGSGAMVELNGADSQVLEEGTWQPLTEAIAIRVRPRN